MFHTFQWISNLATNESNKMYATLDERIDQFLKLSSLSILTIIFSPLIVSYDIGYELGNQYTACSRRRMAESVETVETVETFDTVKKVKKHILDPPVLTLRRSARLAAKQATIS